MARSTLIVVPDSDRVEQWLVDAARDATFIDARSICTVGQLVERCEPARWSNRSPADPLLVRMLLATLAPALAERTFGAVARTPEFAAQAQELLSHLRAQNVTPSQLAQVSLLAGEALGARARALATLWERLDEALESRGLIDAGELVRLATRRLSEEGLPPRLQDFRSVAIHHVHDLFPARLSLFEALAQACQRAQVRCAVWWPSSGDAQTDLFVLDALRTIEARWQTLDAEAFAELSDAPLAWIGARAFADEVTASPAPQLELFCAPTPREEMRQLANRAKQAIVDGVPPEQICIAYRDLADDTEAIVEALAELDVPARARLGVPLLASPPGRVAMGLFTLLEDAFPAEDLAELLESRYVQLVPAYAAPPRRTFREAGVRDELIGAEGQRGGYEVRLSLLEGRLREDDVAQREALATLRRAVSDALRIIRGIPEEAPAVELLEAWWDALSRLGLFRSLSERAEPLLQRSPLLGQQLDRALARDQSAGEALLGLLTSLKQSLVASGLATRRLTRKDFSRHVRRAAQDLNLLTRGPRAGAVWLLDARELGGRHFELLLLGGLVDGRFPGRPNPLPLLNEDERTALNRLAKTQLFRLSVNDSGVRLPLRLAEDRLLLHLALCAGQSVVLGRARLDGAGREALASPFRDALQRVLEGLREVQVVRAPAPAIEAARSERELQERVALEVLCPPQTRQTARDPRVQGLLELFGQEPWLCEARQVSEAETERLLFFSDPQRPAARFSGRLEGAILEALQPRLEFDSAHPVSAAQLNVWGQCAFRGLGLRVLGLAPSETTGEEPDGRARGSFWHEVLKELVPELDRRSLLDGTPQNLRPLVEAAVEKARVRFERTTPTGHPELWAINRTSAATMLHRLVSATPVIRPFAGARVLGVELEFGTGRGPIPALHSVKVPAVNEGERDVHVRGRIDRIDGSDGQAGVIDYKSSVGDPGPLNQAFLTSDFQLPFYLLAVKQWHPARRLQAAWVGMRKRDVRTLDSVVPAHALGELLALDAPTRAAAKAQGRKNVANSVHELLAHLRSGNFGARPTDCEYCELKAVCRISQRRMLSEGN